MSWTAIVRASWSFVRFRSALAGGNEDEAPRLREFFGAGVDDIGGDGAVCNGCVQTDEGPQ